MCNIEFPIVIDNILPIKNFNGLRDEFRYIGWTVNNRSHTDDGYSWGWDKNLNRANLLCICDAAGIIKLKIQKYIKQNLNYIRSHVNGQTSDQHQEQIGTEKFSNNNL